jgi:hypothetical protein
MGNMSVFSVERRGEMLCGDQCKMLSAGFLFLYVHDLRAAPFFEHRFVSQRGVAMTVKIEGNQLLLRGDRCQRGISSLEDCSTEIYQSDRTKTCIL